MAQKTNEEVVVEVVEEPKQEEKAEVVEVKQTQGLSVNAFGSVADYKEYFKLAQALASSDLVPDAYKNKPANCVIALEQANRMGVSPMVVMQNLYIVKGKPTWSGSACSMLVNGSGLFTDVKLVYVGEKGKENFGAYVKAKRVDTGEEVIGTTVDMAMVKAFGWSSNPMWQKMSEQMLGYRAYSFFARLHCPNALNGFSTEGEVEDTLSSRHEVPTEF